MAIELKLPELGENIESADVVSLLVKEGDKIQKDQGLFEIETDKATIEVPSTQEGVVQKILIKPGDKIKVGQTVLMIEGSSLVQEKTAIKKEADKKTTAPAPKEEIKKEVVAQSFASETKGQILDVKLPDLGENIESADVVTVLVKPGERIDKDQSIIEIETDKATVEVPSPYSGEVIEVFIKQGDKAKVGAALLKLKVSESLPEPKKKIEQTSVESKTETPSEDTAKIQSESYFKRRRNNRDLWKGISPTAHYKRFSTCGTVG